jgi:hypothetical protein
MRGLVVTGLERIALMRWLRRRSRNASGHAPSSGTTPESRHDSPPAPSIHSDDFLEAAIAAIDPEYAGRLEGLGAALSGKVVEDSQAGHSGYLLRFTDGFWVAVWLDPSTGRMEFATGDGAPPTEVTALLSNPAVPDASAPLNVDRPYASEPNDIRGEARRVHGSPVTGIAIGERAFNLCFPGDMELDGTVFPNAEGCAVLRVFYEQW